MKKIDEIRKFLNKYLSDSSSVRYEALTEYVGIDMPNILMDIDNIQNFFLDNFDLYGNYVSYASLCYLKDGNKWIEIEDKKSLDIFNKLLAVGLAANVFVEDMLDKFCDLYELRKKDIKYLLPETFEYIDEEYYEGLNKKIINVLGVDINTQIYYKQKTNHSLYEILEYWWNSNNPNHEEADNDFYQMLHCDPDYLLSVAAILFDAGVNAQTLGIILKEEKYDTLNEIALTISDLDPDAIDQLEMLRNNFIQYFSEMIDMEKRSKSKKKNK
ncbi:MAG: hypothetical protein K6C11_04455 [Bacilli bacterium]|nr:hypothetical protein [Bacilli bacterium]